MNSESSSKDTSNNQITNKDLQKAKIIIEKRVKKFKQERQDAVKKLDKMDQVPETSMEYRDSSQVINLKEFNSRNI
eukprot:CAMPEP_0116899032 /NCGR_PEP_ID=MMETSP0467-20121206/7675_1 /TAXON_ID=283647 /ORGANISM="Mesodinium pulex, Strain SPMC105" /LENGTH=75 /DNA_ID=CAMNT_0004571595 /DNA_START=72 /DNA_END=299 /DNA_ORIENTATION=-